MKCEIAKVCKTKFCSKDSHIRGLCAACYQQAIIIVNENVDKFASRKKVKMNKVQRKELKSNMWLDLINLGLVNRAYSGNSSIRGKFRLAYTKALKAKK
tara:strand:- start:70 stop:366 length:297 start_codon:yes stop_codon:yes gene_type:complete